MFISSCLCFLLYAHHRDLHVLTHSFPTRRSADLGRLARDLPTDCPQVGTKPVGRALIHLVTRTAHGECGRLWRRGRHFAMRHCRCADHGCKQVTQRSEEHTSELQSLMRISYAVFCLNKKNSQPPLSPILRSHVSTQTNKSTHLHLILTHITSLR